MNEIEINQRDKLLFVQHLVNRIYKILPLAESNYNIVPKVYVERLLIDMHSANNLFNGELINLIVKINVLNKIDLSHKQIKSIIFDSISFCNMFLEKLKESGGK